MKARLALLLPLLGMAACTPPSNASVRAEAICSPPDDPSSCTFAATCGTQYIGQIAIDLALTNKLWLLIQVNNLLPDNTDLTINKTNTNDALVQEYEIEYEGLPLTVTAPVLGSAVIPAAGTSVISVLVVPESIGNIAPAYVGTQLDVVARLKLKGVLADTSKFETDVFKIPFRACNGCLGVVTCTAPEVVAFCPPNIGQLPLAQGCVTP